MTRIVRHARGLVIAFVVLLLSASIVLGAKALPEAASHGLETAAAAAGKVVPVRTGQTDEEVVEAPLPEADGTDEEEAPAAEDAGAHGAIVSEAAQMETPEGFANHGAWVSCVAHLTKLPVEEGAEPLTLEDITPEACAAADEAKQAAKDAAKAAREADRAAAKAERNAAKAERAAAKAERAAARDAKRAAKHGGT